MKVWKKMLVIKASTRNRYLFLAFKYKNLTSINIKDSHIS